MDEVMDEFLSAIQDMITESEDALNQIEKAIFTKRYRLSQKHFSLFSVQSISMMYSIWEGFIQKSFKRYLLDLNKMSLSYQDFHDNFIILHMETKFKQFNSYPKKGKRKIEFYKNLQQFYINNENVSFITNVNTESNVNFKVLNKLLSQFCLTEFPQGWEKYYNPNLEDTLKTFVNYRNAISHGGDISSEESVTQEVYSRYKTLVLDLMNAIYDKFEEAITNKTYLK